MSGIRHLLSNQTGAVSVDWIVISAGLLIAGLVAIHSISNSGVKALVLDTTSHAVAAVSGLERGNAPNINR